MENLGLHVAIVLIPAAFLAFGVLTLKLTYRLDFPPNPQLDRAFEGVAVLLFVAMMLDFYGS